MIDRYTKEQVRQAACLLDGPYFFAVGERGWWCFGRADDFMKPSGIVNVINDGSIDGSIGDYKIHYSQVIAIIPAAEIDKVRELVKEMDQITSNYHEECKAPLLKLNAGIAILQAKYSY